MPSETLTCFRSRKSEIVRGSSVAWSRSRGQAPGGPGTAAALGDGSQHLFYKDRMAISSSIQLMNVCA